MYTGVIACWTWELTQNGCELLVEEDVVKLYVTMNDAVATQVRHGRQQLEADKQNTSISQQYSIGNH